MAFTALISVLYFALIFYATPDLKYNFTNGYQSVRITLHYRCIILFISSIIARTSEASLLLLTEPTLYLFSLSHRNLTNAIIVTI